jgi:hypothetical protein
MGYYMRYIIGDSRVKRHGVMFRSDPFLLLENFGVCVKSYDPISSRTAPVRSKRVIANPATPMERREIGRKLLKNISIR